jgi:hypothetical protein
VTYRTLQRQFQLDDGALNDLKDELLYGHPQVRDDAGYGLVWMGDPDTVLPAATALAALIDLTAVTCIDEAAAAVVRQLSQSPSVSLTGCQLFTQQMIEAVPSGEGREARDGTAFLPPRAQGARLGHREHASGTDVTPLRERRSPQ